VHIRTKQKCMASEMDQCTRDKEGRTTERRESSAAKGRSGVGVLSADLEHEAVLVVQHLEGIEDLGQRQLIELHIDDGTDDGSDAASRLESAARLGTSLNNDDLVPSLLSALQRRASTLRDRGSSLRSLLGERAGACTTISEAPASQPTDDATEQRCRRGAAAVTGSEQRISSSSEDHHCNGGADEVMERWRSG
jgi:hypothetical protein